MTNEVLQYIIKAKDEASKVFQDVARSSEAAEGKLQSLVPSSMAVQAAFLAAGAAGVGLGVKMVQSAAKMEQTKIAFTTLLGSAEEAGKVIENIKKEAAATPFEQADLFQYNIQLISAGENAGKSMSVIKDLGDAVSAVGGGGAEMSRLIGNMQQIKSVGKATAQDIKQFGNAGIDIYSMLAETTGKTIDQVKEMDVTYDLLTQTFSEAARPAMSLTEALADMGLAGQDALDNRIPPDKVEALSKAWQTAGDDVDEFNAVLDSMGEGGFIDTLDDMGIGVTDIMKAFDAAEKSGGRFAGSMDNQSQTLIGRWSTLNDNIDILMITLGEKLLPLVAPVIDSLIAMVENLNTAFTDGTVEEYINTITTKYDEFKTKIDEIFVTLTSFWDEHKTAIETTAAIITGIFMPALINLGVQAIVTGTQLFVGMIANIIQMGIQATITTVTGMWGLIQSIITFVIEGWKMVAVIGAKIIQFALATAATIIHTTVTIAQTVATVALTAATWLFNAALAVLTSPIFLVVAAIVALIAIGVLLWKNWDVIKAKAAEITEAIRQKWQDLKQKISEIGESLYNKLVEPFTKAWDKIKGIADNVRHAIADAFNLDKRNSPSINDRLGTLKETVQGTLDSISVPKYSHDIATALAPASNTNNEQNNTNIFNNTINQDLDIAVVDQQIAISLTRRGMY